MSESEWQWVTISLEHCQIIVVIVCPPYSVWVNFKRVPLSENQYKRKSANYLALSNFITTFFINMAQLSWHFPYILWNNVCITMFGSVNSWFYSLTMVYSFDWLNLFRHAGEVIRVSCFTVTSNLAFMYKFWALKILYFKILQEILI